MGDDRPPRYVEGDTIIYRSSSLVRCTRAVLADARGTWPAEPLPDNMRTIFDEGHAAEPIIRQLWDEYTGIPTQGTQDEFELEVGEVDGKLIVVRGHIDGWADTPDGRALREYKKVRESGWDDMTRKGVEFLPNYPWQVATYMHGTGYEVCEFVAGRMVGTDDDGGPIIDDVQVHYVTNPPIPLKAIRDRLVRWERMIAAGMDPSDVECDVAMYPCPYFKFHDEKDEESFDLTGDTLAALKAWADIEREYQRLTGPLKAIEKKRKAASEAARQVLDEAGAKNAKHLTVNGVPFATRKRAHYPERTTRAYDTDSLALVKKDTI